MKSMKKIVDGKEVEMTEEEIQSLEQSRIVQWNEASFLSDLSLAFDAKFEEYWKAKRYFDLNDLNSHAANQNSKYHEEALMLIEWSHEQWELAIHNIDENSNIEEIINSLHAYE